MFLTEFGQAVGVTADGFDEAEMLFYKVNNRKYKVLDDRQFQIKSPLTLQYTASTWVDGTDYTKFAPMVSNTSGNCSKQNSYEPSAHTEEARSGLLRRPIEDVSQW